MIDPETLLQGKPGDAKATFKVLRDPSESRSLEVLPDAEGGARVVVQHCMDGWGLWRSPVFPVKQETVLTRVRYALSREGLFDA